MLHANDGIETPRRRGTAQKKFLCAAAAVSVASATASSSCLVPVCVSPLTSTSSSANGPKATPSRELLIDNLAFRGGAQGEEEMDNNKWKKKKQSKRPKSNEDKGVSDNSPSATPGQDARQQNPTKSAPSRIVENILHQDDFYDILGLSQSQVRQAADPLHLVTKAYRRRCVHTHPDKTGGDRRAFDKVAEAYHVLSDDSKRKVYDRFGKQGLQHHQGGGPSPFAGFGTMSAEDLFRSFFEGSNPFRQPDRPFRSNRTTHYQLEVSLLDLYQGLTKTVRVAPPHPSSFHGRKPESSVKSVEVHVPRGALEGASIILSGAMDFDPNQPPADLVFVIRQVPHPVFQRKGYDLAMTLTISLSEALCGFSKTITHLDGKPLHVAFGADNGPDDGQAAPPEPIKSGDVHVLKGKGMPKDEMGRDYGNLYIFYKVTMPQRTNSRGKALTGEERRDLKRLLSKLEGSESESRGLSNESENGSSPPPLTLQKASLSEFGRSSGQPPRPTGPHWDNESHFFEQNDHQFSSSKFGNQFFFSSSAGTANPFTGMQRDVDEENESVQCRQM